MKTLAEMQDILSSMGIKKRFKPYCEGERNTVLLHVRKPAKIIDGYLEGCEIDIYDSSTFRVWTSRRQKAMVVAKQNNLKVRLMDGEAELYVPAGLADELLPRFGAKIKYPGKPLSEARKAAQIATLARFRQTKTAPPATETEKPYQDSGKGGNDPKAPILTGQSQEINKTAKI